MFRSLFLSKRKLIYGLHFQAEKIRLVGVSLIAIIQERSPFEVRARRDFAVLLDILSQLDSNASNSLNHEIL